MTGRWPAKARTEGWEPLAGAAEVDVNHDDMPKGAGACRRLFIAFP
jgi:hypothetical protein